MRKTFVAAIAAVEMAGGSAFAQQKVVKIGVPLPLTGSEAKFGEMEKQAYEMAAEEINAKGGVKGQKLVLDIQDSGGKPETATAIVEKFVTIEKYHVPYLVVTGAADKITQQGWKNIYRLNPPASLYNLGVFSFFEKVAKP